MSTQNVTASMVKRPAVGLPFFLPVPAFQNRAWRVGLTLEGGSTEHFDVVGFDAYVARIVADDQAQRLHGDRVRAMSLEVYP